MFSGFHGLGQALCKFSQSLLLQPAGFLQIPEKFCLSGQFLTELLLALLIILFRKSGGHLQPLLNPANLFAALAYLHQSLLQIDRLMEGLGEITGQGNTEHNGDNLRRGCLNPQNHFLNGRMNHLHQEHGKNPPGQRRRQTDMTVQIHLLVAVIPVAHMKHPLHACAGHIFQNCRSQHAQQKNQRDTVPDTHRTDENRNRAEPVNRQKRTVQKSPVDPPALFH